MFPKWFRKNPAPTSKKSYRKSKWGLWRSYSGILVNRPLSLEMLEERTMLSVTWINPGSGNWDVAANWSTDSVPGSGDDAVINIASAATITIKSGDSESVHSLTTAGTDTLSITGGTLTVAAPSSLVGPLAMTGGSLTVSGSGASLTATGSTTVSEANLFAFDGGSLSLPQLTSYETHGTFQADGAGSLLDVSNLVTLSSQPGFWQIDASHGGTINLTGLTSLNSDDDIAISDTGGSTLIDPNVTTLSAITRGDDLNVTLDGTDAHVADSWTSFTNGSLTVSGGAYSLPGLTDVDQSNLTASGGGHLTLLGLTSYATWGTFQADGAGSLLDVSNLVTLSSQPGFWQIEASHGGNILSVPSTASFSLTITSGSNLTGKNFGDVLTSITVPLTLPPTTPFPSQGSANADYVEAIYRAVLDRNADPGGLSSWTGHLNDGSYTRLQVVQGIRNSPEHFGQEIDVFYETLLGRAADPQGLANWVGQLENGTREEQIAFDFLDSPEYLSKGDKFFVDAMYLSLLGRAFDPTGETSWLNALGDDSTGNLTHAATLTHAQVINDFLFSGESLDRLVEGYYEVFLLRQADPGGLKGWVTELQDGLPFLTIGQEFIASDEFYNNAAGNK